MDRKRANASRKNSSARFHVEPAPVSPIRRAILLGVGGAIGGGVFALIQHLGPELLRQPILVRWVFLYALLGGVIVGVWKEATRWTVARFSLSRRGAAVVSCLVAGMLVGAATLLVTTLKQGGGGDGLLLLRLPWTDGLGGFVGGAVGGYLGRYLRLR